MLHTALARQRQLFAADPSAAAKAIKVGESKPRARSRPRRKSPPGRSWPISS